MVQKICTQVPSEKEDNIYKIKYFNSNKLRAAFFKSKLWDDNKIIKVKFLQNPSRNLIYTKENSILDANSDPDPLQDEFWEAREKDDWKSSDYKDWIKRIVQERIEPIINIKFNWVGENDDADIHIAFDPTQGCWSYVGKDALKYNKNDVTMNFAWFDIATVIHEFGHSIGMVHEHQNPRGEKIEWNVPALDKYMADTQGWDKETTKNNIINKYNINQISGSQFDPLSIMLYFYPDDLTTNGEGTKINLRLSGLDVKWLWKTYKPDNINEDDLNTIYESWYNESIDENINKSSKLAKEMDSDSNTIPTQTIIIIILGFIIIIVFTVGLYFLVKKLRKKL